MLLYHAIGGSALAVTCEGFRAQMEWLASCADILPLDVMLRREGAAPLQVAITFDDGYVSLHSEALPVLRGVGARAAAFLNTGWIAETVRKASSAAQGHYPDERFLLWREVGDLAAAGWTIGSHGVGHLDLTVQDDERVRHELSASRQAIAARLGACSPVFSYTWGRHNAHLRQLVAQDGYSHAVAGIHAPYSDMSDPLAIPRINIDRGYTLDDFKAIVAGDWDYLGWWQRLRAGRWN
ncbi:MAG TPA: polysaccharide deacetylase family protein [Pseudolabrys sp.]|nr:polysaccharide deacetylase family protein [Pseudolabrys sp.]